MSDNRRNQDSNTKLEIANKIASQRQKVARTAESIEDSFLRTFRWFSSWIDKVFFNPRYGKIVSLVLALAIYLTVNFNSENSLFSSALQSSKTLNNFTITALYNEETFEVSGLPAYADITISGDAQNVTSAANHGGNIVVNLEGLTEGVHNVKLTTQGFNDNVNIKIEPSNAVITLKKKTTRQFDLSYDFINLDKMENIYSVGTPEFEYTKINVRASKDTLDTIAFVKALIDVTGQSSEFTNDAILVAYDKSGQPVKADIIPNTVKVTVPVTSPNKTVAIIAEATGEVMEGMAIDSITLDQQTVTIYAPESVLSKIDQVVVNIDMSTITKDSTVLRPITLPTGVNSVNINQVTMDVKLDEAITKTVDGVTINYKNNVNNYRFGADDNITTVSVDVTGTKSNIDNIKADDINVFFDMAEAVPGPQEFQLNVEKPSNSFVKYTLKQTTYKGVVVGDTVDNIQNEGAQNE
ncbi:MAG TPA: hypothetical protein DHS57_02905 [Erysipelotrichaceae bacterium]|nr:CdaR family protein [Bacillota bacterium]HCY06240.1 hypothetical protein [Erysipelotrichaceae bacterium]